MATSQLIPTMEPAPRGLRFSGIPVLMYHGLDNGPVSHASRERKYWVGGERFAAHLRILSRDSYQTGLLDGLWNGLGREPRAAILTFDDGHASDYEIAFPLLQDAGIRAVFFVNPATVGERGYLTWERMREMQRAGMSFQSHGYQHLNLAHLGLPALRWQLAASKEEIEGRLGCRVDYLAAPFGGVNPRVASLALLAGYKAVCGSHCRPAHPDAPVIDRIPIYSSTGERDFQNLIEGSPAPYIKRRARSALLQVPKWLMSPPAPRPPRKRKIAMVVLIDAMGWQLLPDRQFLPRYLPYARPLRTTLGFSSGAIPTILTGVLPAEHGHWNLYYRDPVTSPFRWLKPFLRLPELWTENRYTRRLLREAGRRLLGLGPLFDCAVSTRLLPQFNWVEKKNIYAPGGISGAESIFDRVRDLGIRSRVFSYYDGSDHDILERASRELKEGDSRFFFLYLSELDLFLHHNCHNAKRVQDRLEWYSAGLEQLFERAREIDPEARLCVFSDHGMTPVVSHFDLVAEIESLGLETPKDYLAVYDSTMARFWCFTPAARQRILARLRGLKCGRILDDAELENLGVLFPDRRYGETIFLLHPGGMLSHSGFNGPGWMPSGMHGYHPDDPDSDAVFMSNFEPPRSMSGIDEIHARMCEVLLEAAS